MLSPLLRRLGLASLLLPVQGCLVVAVPDFQPADQTPPALVAADASPDLRQPLVVTDLAGQPALSFGASVSSQDRGPVYTQLLIDYGLPNIAGQKAQHVIRGRTLPAGALHDPPRPVLLTWYPSIHRVPGGCHTVTLVVSHGFDDAGTGCPQRLCDASFLVWQVLLPCADGETCSDTCAPPTDTCPAQLEEGVDPAITCPGDSP